MVDATVVVTAVVDGPVDGAVDDDAVEMGGTVVGSMVVGEDPASVVSVVAASPPPPHAATTSATAVATDIQRWRNRPSRTPASCRTPRTQCQMPN